MKRIFYGNLTIDAAEELADRVLALSSVLAGQPSSAGRAEIIDVVGYIPGWNDACRVQFVLGPGIPVAVAPCPTSLDDPDETGSCIESITATAARYEDA